MKGQDSGGSVDDDDGGSVVWLRVEAVIWCGH